MSATPSCDDRPDIEVALDFDARQTSPCLDRLGKPGGHIFCCPFNHDASPHRVRRQMFPLLTKTQEKSA